MEGQSLRPEPFERTRRYSRSRCWVSRRRMYGHSRRKKLSIFLFVQNVVVLVSQWNAPTANLFSPKRTPKPVGSNVTVRLIPLSLTVLSTTGNSRKNTATTVSGAAWKVWHEVCHHAYGVSAAGTFASAKPERHPINKTAILRAVCNFGACFSKINDDNTSDQNSQHSVLSRPYRFHSASQKVVHSQSYY
jgi:hypothetical protein